MPASTKSLAAAGTGGRYAFMRTVLAGDLGGGLYRKRKAMVEPVFSSNQAQPADQRSSSGEEDPPLAPNGG